MSSSFISAVGALPDSSTSMLLLLLKATIILVAALAITVTMQKASAGARHLVWLVTLGALLIVPALASWSPFSIRVLPAPTAVESPVVSQAPALDESGLASVPASPQTAPVAYTTDGNVSGKGGGFAAMSLISLSAGIWLAVMLAIAAWLAWGALAVRRIVRNAHPLDTTDWMVPLWEIADRLELDEPPRLLSSADAKMPFACGFISPTIVLPVDCDTWTPDRRQAVLLHELAHVKRRDLVGHTLGRLVCAAYWFHPLVWTAAKQLRNESERACDDLALSCGAKPSDYAEHLLDIVTSVRHDATPAVALAMARRKDFEGRMLAILDPDLRHSTPSRRQSLVLAGSLALIAIAVGATGPTSRAVVINSSAGAPVAQGPAVEPRDELDDATELDANKSGNVVQSTVSAATDLDEADEPGTATVASANAIASAVASATGSQSRKSVYVQFGESRVKDLTNADADERPALLSNILLTEKEASLRRIAAWGLSEYSSGDVAMNALSTALLRDADASVREMAAWALSNARRRSPAVTALSTALTRDAVEKVRARSAWSLGQIGDRESVVPLSAALADAGKDVRSRAVWAIGAIGPSEAPPALIAALRDPDPSMRKLVAWALYQIEDPAAAPALNAALKSETDSGLKIDYIRALAAIGEHSVDVIRDLLLSTDPKVKSMAIRALAGGQGAGPWPRPWPEPRPQPR